MYSTRVETWPSERPSPVRRLVALVVIIAPLVAGAVLFSRASGNVMAFAFHGAAPCETAEPRFQLDDLSLDPETYEVTVRGSIVRLTPTEFRILYLLATNAGHVVPASRIYTYVWGSEGGDANALRSHISHLRHKLELLDPAQGTITSVPAVGYVMRRATGLVAATGGALVEAEASAAS